VNVTDFDFRLTPFQTRVLQIPEPIDLFLGGGRGGGKSMCMVALVLRAIEQYGPRANCVLIKQSYPSLADTEATTRYVFGGAYGSSATYNAASHAWKFPNGGRLTLAQLADPSDLIKFQGQSYSLILVDEAQAYPDMSLLDVLRSNLRAPTGVPVRFCLAANPGGPAHAVLSERYVFRAAPWTVFLEPKSQRQFVYCPSTLEDNTAIDRAAYRKQLEASTATDEALRAAWLHGDWSTISGAFFATVLCEERCSTPVWDPDAWPRRARRGWRLYLSMDYGSTAPAVVYVCCQSPGAVGPDNRYYSRGSVVLADELATCEPGSLVKGRGQTLERLADEIIELAERWDIPAMGVADDACFAQHGHTSGSIAEELRNYGVNFSEARKGDRRTSLERLRQYLANAGKPDVPGMYVSRACAYFWATMPWLPRDPRRPDDIDCRAADHACDAARYALGKQDSIVANVALQDFLRI
jgi:hypothetical protein